MGKSYVKLKLQCPSSFTETWLCLSAFRLQNWSQWFWQRPNGLQSWKYLLSGSSQKKSLPTLVLHMGRDFSQFHVPNHLWHFKVYFKNCIVISMGWLILWYVPFFTASKSLKKMNAFYMDAVCFWISLRIQEEFFKGGFYYSKVLFAHIWLYL